MAAYVRQRPAGWFWLVGMMVTLWGLAGCAAWGVARAGLMWPVVDVHPGIPLALAAGAVLGGGIALLNKKLFARVLFTIAIAAAFAQILWLLVAQGWVTGQGLFAGAILLGAALLLRFAEHARRRGWIS